MHIFHIPYIRVLKSDELEELTKHIGDINCLPVLKYDDPIIKLYNSENTDKISVGAVIYYGSDADNLFKTPRIVK